MGAGGQVVTHLPLMPVARVQLPDVALSRTQATAISTQWVTAVEDCE